MDKFSVVVPIYNEKGSLRELHRRLLAVMAQLGREFEIIFVDDGSIDGSFEVMKDLAPLKAVRLKRNFGQSTAIGVGFELAQGDVIITIDSDLENEPEDIPRLLEKLNEGFDMVSGWRKSRWQGKPISRYLPSWLANKLISSISRTYLNDNGCQLKVYRREILQNINMTGERHRMIAAFIALEGGRITEIPISFKKRKYGKTKYGLTRTFKVILDLLAFHFFRKYASRPIHFFGGVGFVSLFLGFLSFIWALYLKVFSGVNFNRSPLLILTAVFIIVGFQFILLGLLAEILIGNHNNPSGRQSDKNCLIREIANNQ